MKPSHRPIKPPRHGWLLLRIFGYLHHLACHGEDKGKIYRFDKYPGPSKKWSAAYRRFHNHHYGVRGSARFLNNYTMHRWG
jgi:hypothetical protein